MYCERLGQIFRHRSSVLITWYWFAGFSRYITISFVLFIKPDHFCLLEKIEFVPKPSLATCPREYYDWEDDMEDFFYGRGLESPMYIYYAEETVVKDVLMWWLKLQKYDCCWTWREMKVVLRHRFAPPLESKKRLVLLVAKIIKALRKMCVHHGVHLLLVRSALLNCLNSKVV